MAQWRAISRFAKNLEESKGLLTSAGLWRAAIGYWVRSEASKEAEWNEEEETKVIKELEEIG